MSRRHLEAIRALPWIGGAHDASIELISSYSPKIARLRPPGDAMDYRRPLYSTRHTRTCPVAITLRHVTTPTSRVRQA